MKKNDINGGSYRIYCRKFIKGSIKTKNENINSMMKQFVKRAKATKKNGKFYQKTKKMERKFFYMEHLPKATLCYNIIN